MSTSFGAHLRGSFVVNALGAAALFLSQFIVAHFAGVDSFGVFAFILSWVQVVVIFSKLGFDTAAQRLLPQYLVGDEYGLIKGLVLGSGLWVACVATLGGGVIAIWATLSSESAVMIKAIFCAALLIPAMALVKLTQGVLLGFRLTVRAQLFDPLLIYLAWLIAIVADVLQGVALTPSRLMVELLIATTFALIAHLAMLYTSFPRRARFVQAEFRMRDWSCIAIPMLLVHGFVALMNYTDVILIGLLLGTDEAGVYAVSARFAASISLPMAFLGSALGPMVSELIAKNDLQSLQSRITTTSRFGLALALPVAVLLWVGSESILNVVGVSYAVGSDAMRVLIVAQLINVVVGPVGLVLMMSGQHWQMGRMFAITAVVNLVLNVLLIPLMGMLGAAVATAIAIIMRNFLLRAQLNNMHGLNTSVFRKV